MLLRIVNKECIHLEEFLNVHYFTLIALKAKSGSQCTSYGYDCVQYLSAQSLVYENLTFQADDACEMLLLILVKAYLFSLVSLMC